MRRTMTTKSEVIEEVLITINGPILEEGERSIVKIGNSHYIGIPKDFITHVKGYWDGFTAYVQRIDAQFEPEKTHHPRECKTHDSTHIQPRHRKTKHKF